MFADELPMKEVMIYTKVRKNCMMGQTPHHRMEAHSKNCYSILAAVTIKGRRMSPEASVVLEECTDSCIFLLFAKILLKRGVLSREDMFVVDNYTVHTKGDNTGL